MKNILNYKDFHNEQISEQKVENYTAPKDEHVTIVELTDDGIITEDSEGQRTIINNEDDVTTNVTNIEEV